MIPEIRGYLPVVARSRGAAVFLKPRFRSYRGRMVMDDIASILAAAEAGPHVVEGTILDDLWVTSGPGDGFEDDHTDLLLHLDDGTVLRARVTGSDAQVVAAFGRGDTVRAVVRGKGLDDDVVLVEDVGLA